MPFTPIVRAPYTCTTASRVVSGSGARPSASTGMETKLARAAKAVSLRYWTTRRTLMQGILASVCDVTTRQCRPRHEPSASLQRRKVVKLPIEEVRGPHLGQRPHDRFDASGVTFFPVAQHLGHELALQVLLRAAKGARDDWKRLLGRIGGEIFFSDVGKRPDHHVFPVIRAQLRRHGLELAAVEQVEEERGEDVVAMMTQGDL